MLQLREGLGSERNYADYKADRRRRLGAEADQPHRIRYKTPNPELITRH